MQAGAPHTFSSEPVGGSRDGGGGGGSGALGHGAALGVRLSSGVAQLRRCDCDRGSCIPEAIAFVERCQAVLAEGGGAAEDSVLAQCRRDEGVAVSALLGARPVAKEGESLQWICVWDLQSLRLEVTNARSPTGSLGTGSTPSGRSPPASPVDERYTAVGAPPSCCSFDMADLPVDWHMVLRAPKALEAELKSSWLYETTDFAGLLRKWTDSLFDVRLRSSGSPPSPVMKCKERRWPRGEAEQRMHGELISKRSHVMTCRGRRMQDWLEVLDSALCLADKLAYLQRAAFSEHVKSVLREELLSGSEN